MSQQGMDHTLTGREQEVMALMLTAATNKSIATALSISIKTVEHHVSAVLRKHNVRSRSELMVLKSSWAAPRSEDVDTAGSDA